MATLIHETAYCWARCSNCKKIFPEPLFCFFNDCQYKPQFNFCPNCSERIERKQVEVKDGKK